MLAKLKYIKISFIGLALVGSVLATTYSPVAFADVPPADNGCSAQSTEGNTAGASDPLCDQSGVGDCSNLNQCTLIQKYINPAIRLLTALVGIGVVLSIIIGGIQYTSSAGDPQKVGAAKERIRNSIIALLVFLFLIALLNFIIPGGLV